MPEPLFIDPEKTAYACKTCRTVLFGTDQLQDPPHVPRMHSFSKQQQLLQHALVYSYKMVYNGWVIYRLASKEDWRAQSVAPRLDIGSGRARSAPVEHG